MLTWEAKSISTTWDDTDFGPYKGGIVGYVFHDNGTSPNVDVVAHMDASQDDGTRPDSHVITNDGHTATLHADGHTVVEGTAAAMVAPPLIIVE